MPHYSSFCAIFAHGKQKNTDYEQGITGTSSRLHTDDIIPI